MRLLPMGATAVLVDDPPGDPAAWSLGLRSLGLEGLIDVVPAATTVLIRCGSDRHLAAAVARLDDVVPFGADGAARPTVITIPVRYDGIDLDEVAQLTAISAESVIAIHSSATYEVAFCGFAPGFGYLRGLPSVLHLPRRHTPRTRVPAGSVAIAAEYSAVYPTQSPGGWHLLGTTDVTLFDPGRAPPALLEPGTIVRFEPT
jgi:KipI family sensor histidine kinase inhibitor